MQLTQKQTALLNSAKRYFEEGFYDKVSPLLNSLVVQRVNVADVFHMLGTIYYEHGQFKASINSFKQALKIDPDFTDSSIGLSVVLNDLGKYEQASLVFKEAQNRLKNQSAKNSINSLTQKIALKHLELSELYKKNKDLQRALQNIIMHEEFVGESEESLLKKTFILRALNNFKSSIQLLKAWLKKNSSSNKINIQIYISLVESYYLDRQLLSAFFVCEKALKIAPDNLKLLKIYENLKTTKFNLRQPEGMTL